MSDPQRPTAPVRPDDGDADDIAHRILDAVGRTQWVAVDVTSTWARLVADRLPAVPGVPEQVLTGPAHVTDSVFASVEDAIGDHLPLVRDVVHQQGAFVAGMFASVQPVIDALAGRHGQPPPAT